MADEFQSGICNGNWWNTSTRNNGLNNVESLPCSTAMNDIGSFGWPNEMVEIKARSNCEESVSVSDSSIVFQDVQKPQGSDSVSGGGSNLLIDSPLQMTGFGLSSSPTMDWNQSLLRSTGRPASNFNSIFHEDLRLRSNYQHETGIETNHPQKDWSSKNFAGGAADSSVNIFKQINQRFNNDQQHFSSSSSPAGTSFSMDSNSYGCPTTLLQGLFEPQFQPQQSSYENYPSSENYSGNINDLSPSWTKFPQFQKSSPPRQQPSNQLHFSNNAHFWNASAALMYNGRSNILPLPAQTQFLTPSFEEKPSVKSKVEEVRNLGSVMSKGNSQPTLKRPRVETPSPLPTFKVRKEKLGDRITALQQLVSPFGKTDTASVLFEAIEYIKFLHDQVSVLSAPYMKNGAPIPHQQFHDKMKDSERSQHDLRSRGLCLVPISSTFPVTNETTADFWTPTFGGTYR
ncbi:hypothetical protein GIB67_032123 [Kingdonia uniflora]|uniref:BHLH domain-containing protein n=1 Tax=Kingdonia uniflora TaxID=39325 RepID=A0A7J7MX50_9MAGN|nr:hypothetical protein GIB67_032123 [Kingdonia uniflora]